MKICSECQIEKPDDAFNPDERAYDGRHHCCRACENPDVEPPSADEKHCRSCATTKPRDAFRADARYADGLSCYCRACNNRKSREWARVNRERCAATRKAWLARNPDYYAKWRATPDPKLNHKR